MHRFFKNQYNKKRISFKAYLINFKEGLSSFIIAGNSVGTIVRTELYNTDSSNVFSLTKGMVLLNLSKKRKITLSIIADFKTAKTLPKILFKNPKEVISANLVNTFPTKMIKSTTTKNVNAKATIVLVWYDHCSTESFKKCST